MLSINKIMQKLLISALIVVVAINTVQGQSTKPAWWFGVSGAANLNFYDGTTQRLNNSLIAPTAFHDGFGVRPYGSVLAEYRSTGLLGAMLNIGYDGRGAKFDDVIAPCDCPATLETTMSYVSIEPSLRLGSRSSGFYFFVGPRFAFNMQKDFSYTQLKQPNTDGDLSEVRKSIISGQVGMGYDIDISGKNSVNKINLSPFVSFHPYFGQEPRDIESLNITTLRTGIALKFGKGKKDVIAEVPPVMPVAEIAFSVREPKTISAKRQVSETLPLRNSVFFDEGSSNIPNRYIMLSSGQANNFKEDQLQAETSENMTGRSARQLNVYHNILNILGDRMRSNPSASISLSGASAKGAKEGKVFAENVKQYLSSSFGIDGSRISTKGRTKPVIPSEQPGATRELALLREGDRRVDIESASPELLMEVGGGMMKPVQIIATQINPLDSHVIFTVAGAEKLLNSYTLDIANDKGISQRFGPFTKDQESLPGSTILGNLPEGDFKVTMTGQTKSGLSVTKESNVHLIPQNEMIEKAYRYSILFDFDKSKTISSYERFLTDVVTPLISEGSTVIIHGHTDIIGQDQYNYKLSQNRAQQAQKIIERALSGSGKTNVRFETFGFGEDTGKSPFENNLPEERFYNRTVIIDIVSVK